MPARCSVTIDGTKFRVRDAEVGMNTRKDQAGMPVMGTFDTVIRFCVDLNDTKNFPFGSIKKLFDLGNVPTRDKVKDFKVEFWDSDAEQNVICSYKCKAWISSFRTSNVGNENGVRTDNHLLYVDATPVINSDNHQELALGN